ncbi:hypothetical protein M407DRAFT_214049 [Tulasnella calospora MUT 4182]|uniref:Uncharacterized protein n=1 Tax=Tulasnella calospora MUT 4182 TaxID=1051891 RepID=A0A0C3KQW4_9AGAM|nr:hypothetical protein M407DRAFT_214049 [Tulasnella calospora MUT 4182]
MLALILACSHLSPIPLQLDHHHHHPTFKLCQVQVMVLAFIVSNGKRFTDDARAASIIVFTGNEPDGCASFIRSIIRYAFQVGKQYDRRWMASFASTCLVSDASSWYATLKPQDRLDWLPFCRALLKRFPLSETDGPERGGPSAGPRTRASTKKSAPSSNHLQPPRPRPALGVKYSNSAPRTSPPPPPSSHGLLRLDFLDGSIPSRYVSSQLRVGYATVYKADLDGVDDQSRALALNVRFERSENGAFKVFTSDDQRSCIGIDKKSADFSYLAFVPHLTDAWVQPDSNTLQTDIWSVRTDGLMEVDWQQSQSTAPNRQSLQSNSLRVPLGVVCHPKSGSVELMRNPENYCARYPEWYEVMMVFEPFTRPEWMVPADREAATSPTRNSMRLGSQRLKKRRLSKRIGPGGM